MNTLTYKSDITKEPVSQTIVHTSRNMKDLRLEHHTENGLILTVNDNGHVFLVGGFNTWDGSVRAWALKDRAHWYDRGRKLGHLH